MTTKPDISVIGLGIMGGAMAEALDCPTPLFSACVPICSAAMAQGLSQSDTASVCEVLGMIAGVDGPRVKRR